jgi:hypothetical protein
MQADMIISCYCKKYQINIIRSVIIGLVLHEENARAHEG